MPSKKPIDVSIRIKPLIPSYAQSSKSIEDWIIDKCQPFAANVWKTNNSQAKVYDDFMQNQFLPSFRAGSNFTCFLYGQTGEQVKERITICKTFITNNTILPQVQVHLGNDFSLSILSLFSKHVMLYLIFYLLFKGKHIQSLVHQIIFKYLQLLHLNLRDTGGYSPVAYHI